MNEVDDYVELIGKGGGREGRREGHISKYVLFRKLKTNREERREGRKNEEVVLTFSSHPHTHIKQTAMGEPDLIEIKGVTFCGKSALSSLR